MGEEVAEIPIVLGQKRLFSCFLYSTPLMKFCLDLSIVAWAEAICSDRERKNFFNLPLHPVSHVTISHLVDLLLLIPLCLSFTSKIDYYGTKQLR